MLHFLAAAAAAIDDDDVGGGGGGVCVKQISQSVLLEIKSTQEISTLFYDIKLSYDDDINLKRKQHLFH